MKIYQPKKSKRPGADRRWTVYFIDDHGNMRTLKRFKAIVIAAGALFFLASGFVAVLLFLNKETLRQNKDLKKQFQNSQKQIETLRHDKEILMARLVLAESKTKENIAEGPKSSAEANTADPMTQKPQAASEIQTVKANKKMPPVPETTPPLAASSETPEPELVFSVAVENFAVSREPDSENLNIQFKIINTSSQPQKVSGHAVVVLKGNDLPEHKWLVMPAVGMVGDKPSGKHGKKFSIQRFRTMNFISRTPQHSDAFQSAAVYIFLQSGELLLEQDFAVKLPQPAVSTIKTPSAERPSGQTPPEETSTEETPSEETPSNEDPIKSLNSTGDPLVF